MKKQTNEEIQQAILKSAVASAKIEGIFISKEQAEKSLNKVNKVVSQLNKVATKGRA